MAKSKKMKYVYDTMEEALSMSDSLRDLFKTEEVYERHTTSMLDNGKVLLTFDLKDNGAND